MKKNNLLNKPIVLSLLFFLFSFAASFIVSQKASLFIFCLKCIIVIFLAALLSGLFKEKLQIELNKINKIKIAGYYSMIHIILFVPIGAIFSYFRVEHHIVVVITALMFTGIYLTFGLVLYLGLCLGCKLNLFKNREA